MKFNWKSWTGILVGSTLALLMLFANPLGLDNNSVWGTKRYLIFLAGIAMLGFALLYRKDNFIGKLLNSYNGQLYLGAVTLCAAIITYYVWCVTIGLWMLLPSETHYYDLQATAFSHGHIALEVKPDPRLLALKGVALYEPANRKGIPVIWDATLYKGKYYLYWGPAPALFLALVRLFYKGEVGDNVLTFTFLCGTFLFLTLFILHLWKKYFTETPRWAVWLTIAFVGLVNPMTYILFEPRIYEAAIIGAQFFLIGGTYFLVTAFDRPTAGRLALAGFLLACAAGSRTTLVPSVGFLALIALIWILKTQRNQAIKLISAIALPLLIGAVSYTLYNYARFDAFTEFGYRYQLTSYNLYNDLGKTFSITYILPNMYKNLFNPFEVRNTFPYIFPTRWVGPDWLAKGNYSDFYLLLAESITGIFVGSPFMVFAFLAGVKTFNPKEEGNKKWIVAALAGSALLSFFMLQVFFFTTMRYLLDTLPTLTLLAVIGFWQGLDLLKSRPSARFAYSAFGILLFAYGLVLSFALAISAHFEALRGVNPELLRYWTVMFNQFFK